MKKTILLFLLLPTCHLFGQANQNQLLINDPQNIAQLTSGNVVRKNPGEIIAGVDGSPYIFDWKESKIVSASKDTVSKSFPVRYNAHLDIFEIKTEKGIRDLDQNKIYSVADFLVFNRQYYQILALGQFTLLKKYEATIKKAHYSPAIHAGSQLDQWQINESYFVKNGNTLKKIKLNKKSVLQSLGSPLDEQKKEKVKTLSLSNENDVKVFFQWLNAL